MKLLACCSAGSSADVGSCFEGRTYRYHYWRRINTGTGPTVTFVMLNPGDVYTNVDLKKNATLTRCYGVAEACGYSWLRVINLTPLIEHSPDECLRHQPAPVVEDRNRMHIELALAGADAVAAWGTWSGSYVDCVRKSFLDGRVDRLLCLGHTDSGAPRHPLYVPLATALVPFMRT